MIFDNCTTIWQDNVTTTSNLSYVNERSLHLYHSKLFGRQLDYTKHVQSEEPVKETIIPSEEKVHARHERSKCLNELRKESSRLQQLLKDFETSPEEAKKSQDSYERAFHKFVNSHENYMKYEEDAEKGDLMSDNYKNQQDMKLQLDCMVDVWSSNRERFKNPPSVSGLSFTSYKSRGSRSSSRSRSSNRSSVVERRRAVEETRLKVQTLKEKQELERQLESVQQKGTELNRKIELLSVESEHKQAKIDLAIEQIPDEEIDGMNEYFEEIRNEDEPRPALGTSTTPEQPHPTQDEHLSTTERAETPPVQTRNKRIRFLSKLVQDLINIPPLNSRLHPTKGPK